MAGLLPLLALWVAVPPVSAVPSAARGRRILADGKPLILKGVNWNPVPVGKEQAHGGAHFRGFVEADSDLMVAAGINAVRTYEPITSREVLDILWAKGIHVLNTVYFSGDDDASSAAGPVSKLKDHPAILMWVIGNEWNYNMLYSGMEIDSVVGRIREVAKLIKRLDSTHLVATVYGMVPDVDKVEALSDVDVWGATIYTGISFGKLFDTWSSRSEKPFFLAEFGADAYNTKTHSVDEAAQAEATVALTAEIAAHSALTGGVCSGGFIFELADEWWKDGAGSPSMHDVGGVAPGLGPYPDGTFNEEYWGIVRVDGTPRQAFGAYARIAIPGAKVSVPARVSPSDVTPGFRLRACGASPRCHGLLGDCCPTREGAFRGCCSAASKQAAPTGPKHAASPKSALRTTGAPPRQHRRRPEAAGAADGDSSPVASRPPSKCAFDVPVPCCAKGDCGYCSGTQCCPSPQGSVTCPSASKALVDGCIHPKLYDCTGRTGTEGPATTTTLSRTTTAPATTTPASGGEERAAHGGHATQLLHTTEAPSADAPRPYGGSASTTGVSHSEVLTLHTTMQVVDTPRVPGSWVLAAEEASCDSACQDTGGCVEGGWPADSHQFLRVVKGLSYDCDDLRRGGRIYGPSTDGDRRCAWSGHGGAGGAAPRCPTMAPRGMRRFCPCRNYALGDGDFLAKKKRRLLPDDLLFA